MFYKVMIKRVLIYLYCIIFISSCSLSKTISLKKFKNGDVKQWFSMTRGIRGNILYFSVLPLEKDHQHRNSLKVHYKLISDFKTPKELVQLFHHSGYEANLVKVKGLKFDWHPKKYYISDLVYYKLKVTRSSDINIYTPAMYIDKTNFDKIKKCLIKNTKNLYSLTSVLCLKDRM